MHIPGVTYAANSTNEDRCCPYELESRSRILEFDVPFVGLGIPIGAETFHLKLHMLSEFELIHRVLQIAEDLCSIAELFRPIWIKVEVE